MKPGLIEFGYAAAWRAIRLMPESAAARLFDAVADRLHARDGAGVRQLRLNLSRVLGPGASGAQLEAVTAAAMRSYCRYWREAFRLPSYSRADIFERFTLDGHEAFDAHRDRGSGVIVAIPHSGNWDLAGAWVCAAGYPLTTVAERLRPEGLYERFLNFRRGLGMEILPHNGGEDRNDKVLAERLAAGHVVPLVADRDLSRGGVEVKFFGEVTRMPAGPAMLAIRTGAPLYTVVLRYDDPRHCYGKMEGPIPIPAGGSFSERVTAVTQAMADAFATGIAVQPADWHMMQRLWLSDKDASDSSRA